MKLDPGVTIYSGRESFTGDIPDDKAKELGLTPTKEQDQSEPKKDPKGK